MTLQVVFDDTFAVPAPLRALVGVDRFGALVFQRRTRLDALRAFAGEAGAAPVIHLREAADITALVERLRYEDNDKFFLICPAQLEPTCAPESLVTFLRQIAYAPSGLQMPLENAPDRRGWALMRPALLAKFLEKQQAGDIAGFFEQYGETLVEVRDRLRLIDLSDERTLLDFLSGQFDVRHFNSVERHNYTVVKRSKDRAKLKREFDFYRLAPPEMQMFLVQPFDFEDDGKQASYRMERVSVPDMALQWVHGAFSPSEFERFLDHIFHFIEMRPGRDVKKAEGLAAQDALYIAKVTERIAALKAMPAYAKLAPLVENACGGLDALVTRYLDLFTRWRGRFPSGRLVIGHGDPCFSNILYSKTNQHLRLIDPRGASTQSELYTDPYYDVAKLSHSIQGDYDFINQDKFDVAIDETLRPRLSIERPPAPWAKALFNARLTRAGFDPVLTRLCEASLFISMAPLHIDRPRKVLAFLLNASNILSDLENTR